MAATALFAVPEAAQAQSFWSWGPGDYYYYDQRPVRPRRAKIKRKPDPAEAAAKTAAKPVGPLVIAISVEKQRVKVYDANGLFAEAPVSTGTKSHPTPYGVFSIIQKNRHHVSNLYGASMPYMQRITWSGVAMHTGPLPGYAASHGCVRLPNAFAARLWTWTKMGTRVIVAPGEVSPANFSHPKLVARMAPLPTVSAAPTPAASVATALSSPAVTQQRTADAREALASMKGTLSDVVHVEPAGPKAADVKPSETAAPAPKTSDAAAAPSDAAATTAPADPRTGTAAETKTTEQPAAKVAGPSSDDLAVKEQDRRNSDESDDAAAAPTSTDKPADSKSAGAPPADAKPSEAALEIAKPADIAKSPDIVKPAEAASAPAPEPAKPATRTAPRRHNHVAVFISRKDRKLYVRHGYEPVFDTPVEIADADRPLGTHVFTARGDKDDAKALRWSVVSLPQVPRRTAARRTTRQGTRPAPLQSGVIPPLSASEALDRIAISADAMEKIASIIAPGGSLLISDHGLSGWETGKGTDFIVPLR